MYLLLVGLLTLVGCTSVADLGGGRWAVPETIEVRSPFGTNAGYVRLQNCAWELVKDATFEHYEYKNCHTMHSWTPIQSQGQGGQIAIGAGIGLGAGLGAAFGGIGSSSASSAASTSTVIVPGGGHH
jgi:hypothetical protein